MKTIIINRNRNYFKPIIIIAFMLFILYFLVFKFLRNPSEYIYFLLPTKNSVIVFSIVGIITSILVIYLLIRNIFGKDFFLKIDEKGIFNGFFLYKNKHIKWEEIRDIKIIRYNYNNYIGIFLKKTTNNEKGINFLYFKINEISMGTPYLISSGYLNCTFEELSSIILKNWNYYK